MNIQCLTHVSFEDAAYIQTWAQQNGHSLRYTHLYQGHMLPEMDSFDMLIIAGGSMNIYEYEQYPWLKEEKQYIAQAIEKRKLVIGICLGGQLIANVLGGKIIKNAYKEIGWHEVELTNYATKSHFAELPETFMAFHWHGDTFNTPKGAIHLASSEACKNQAFQYASNVIGLQFHLEYTRESIERMFFNCSQELTDGAYIQTVQSIRTNYHYITNGNRLISTLFDKLSNIISH